MEQLQYQTLDDYGYAFSFFWMAAPYFLGMDASHMHPKYIDAIRYILHSQSKP